jgi:ubiquinone/menaquinone biosynthesis C-methylase UbiE
MASDLTFTGERFVPTCSGEIAYEHWHRYAFARQFAAGRNVLDAACGEGYGTALLASVAEHAVGVDIDAETVAHATTSYGALGRIRFVEGSCVSLPFADAMFDVVVSFETVEHLPAADQPRMVAEFARVLKRDGVLVISSPNKRLYSDVREYVNEFHLHELYRADLELLLADVLPVQHWYHQRVSPWSSIWPDAQGEQRGVEVWLGDANAVTPYASPEGMYFVVVAGRDAAALASRVANGSLLTDADETEAKRNDRNARDVMRLDALLRERDGALDRQSAHVLHLESLIVERERIINDINGRLHALNDVREQLEAQRAVSESKIASLAQRLADSERRVAEQDAQIITLDRVRSDLEASVGALEAERIRLGAAVAAQERIIAYRQSARWWVRLPLLRVRLWWERMR